MKFLIICLSFLSSLVFAQDAASILKNFDSKTYPLKSKGVTDFVVDVESSKLTKQMNDQQIFGKVKELKFRVFWTATPERVAVEVLGLPDGFKEIKEDLKMTPLAQIEPLFSPPLLQKYTGYKFSKDSNGKDLVAQDSSGLAPVPTFIFKFDTQEKLVEIIGKKPVGTLNVFPQFPKETFADGKWVLKEIKTESTENGQQTTILKSFDYEKVNGIAALTEIETEVEQKPLDSNAKPVKFSDEIELSNYKINEGEALKYFLAEFPKEAPKK